MFEFLRASRFLSRPVELYLVKYGAEENDFYGFTDGEVPIVHAGKTYYPATIRRSAHTNAGTLDKSSLEIEVDRTNPVPELFRVYPPGYVVSLTIYQGEADDVTGQYVAIWTGRILSCSWEGSECKLLGEPISTAFRRSGLRRNYQYGCPHVLYGPACRADKAVATIVPSVQSVTGNLVVLTSLLSDAGRYSGGVVQWLRTDGQSESRTVVNVYEILGKTQLELNGIARGLVVGVSVNLSLGCRRSLTSCRDDHNNAPNFGGMPWIPLQNPIGNLSPFK